MITHPEKLLFPDDGITKGDLAAYYDSAATLILPHITGRPMTLERYPAGLAAKGFWQKSVVKGFPAWLQRVAVPKKNGMVHYPLINDERALSWMVNQNTITPHVWGSRVPHLDSPDLCVFDLDPPDHASTDAVQRAAIDLRDFLQQLELRSWVKTSGSKGFHLAVPLDGTIGAEDVARFAHQVGVLFVQRYPETLTLEFSKVDRRGKILVDTGRNGYGATFAAPYAVRARAGAPVSAPCSWQEIESGAVEPTTFHLRSMGDRISAVGDLWADLLIERRSLAPALARVEELLHGG